MYCSSCGGCTDPVDWPRSSPCRKRETRGVFGTVGAPAPWTVTTSRTAREQNSDDEETGDRTKHPPQKHGAIKPIAY